METFLLVLAALFPVVNPPGSALVFLSMTRRASIVTRRSLARRVAINAFFVMTGSLLVGAFILKLYGISVTYSSCGRWADRCNIGLETTKRGQRQSSRRGSATGRVYGIYQPDILSDDAAAHDGSRHDRRHDQSRAVPCGLFGVWAGFSICVCGFGRDNCDGCGDLPLLCVRRSDGTHSWARRHEHCCPAVRLHSILFRCTNCVDRGK